MTKHNHLMRQQKDLHLPLLTFRSDLEHLFDDFFRSEQRQKSNANVPKCNIFESEKAYHIDVKLPGLSSQDVDLSLSGNILTVKGEHLDENKADDLHYHLREFSHQSVQRSWELPPSIDAEKLSASFEAGILRIELPKKHAEVSVKKINIT